MRPKRDNIIARAARFAATAAVAAVLAACSLDYESLNTVEAMPEDIPRVVIYGFSHTVVKNGKPAFQIKASKAEEYEAKKVTLLQEVSFIEYDDEGAQSTTGNATQAVFHTDTEDAEMSGSILFRNKVEDAWVKAAYLSWNNDKKSLAARPEDTVSIEKGDGSVVSGRGFDVDARTRLVTFAGGAEGTYVLEDDDAK